MQGGLKYSFNGNTSCSESACLTKMLLIIGHAVIQWCKVNVLRLCIKHKNSSNKGQSSICWLFLGASYKLGQTFGNNWSEGRAEDTKKSLIQGKNKGESKKGQNLFTAPHSTFT